jgi:site-specific recombinase XerD
MEELLAKFREELVRENKSPETMKKYLKDLRYFFAQYSIEEPRDITRDVVRDLVLDVRTKGHGNGHLANLLWAIKKFNAFLKEIGEDSFEWDIKIPVVQAPETVEFIEIEELDKLFLSLDPESIHDLRTRAYIELIINTGMRPSEALNFTRAEMEGLDEIEITGKGRKKRKIYLNERARLWVNEYLSKRDDDLPNLFVTHPDARPMTLRNIEGAFKKAVEKSGISKRFVLHTLRHTYSTMLLINGCPIDYVAVLLGHSKVETTRRHYLAIRQKHARAAHYKYLTYATEPSLLRPV